MFLWSWEPHLPTYQTLGFLQNIFLCWWTNSGYQRLKHLNCLKPFHQKMRDSRVSTGYTASFWTMNSCLSPNFGRMLQSFCAIHLEVAFTKTPIRNCRRIPVITGRQRTWHLQHLKNEQGKNSGQNPPSYSPSKTDSFLTFFNEMVSFHHQTCGFFGLIPEGTSLNKNHPTNFSKWTTGELPGHPKPVCHLWAEHTQVKKTRRSKPAAGTKRCQSSWHQVCKQLFLWA